MRFLITGTAGFIGLHLARRRLEAARRHQPIHLLAAFTSSAYGANLEMPSARPTRPCTR